MSHQLSLAAVTAWLHQEPSVRRERLSEELRTASTLRQQLSAHKSDAWPGRRLLQRARVREYTGIIGTTSGTSPDTSLPPR